MFRFKFCPYLSRGYVIRGLQGPYGSACHFGNVLVSEIVEISQTEYEFLFLRETVDRFHKSPLEPVPVESGVFVYPAIKDTFQTFCLEQGFPPVLAQEIEGLVGRYPINPGKEAGFLPEIGQCAPNLQESVLQEVICIFV